MSVNLKISILQEKDWEQEGTGSGSHVRCVGGQRQSGPERGDVPGSPGYQQAGPMAHARHLLLLCALPVFLAMKSYVPSSHKVGSTSTPLHAGLPGAACPSLQVPSVFSPLWAPGKEGALEPPGLLTWGPTGLSDPRPGMEVALRMVMSA